MEYQETKDSDQLNDQNHSEINESTNKLPYGLLIKLQNYFAHDFSTLKITEDAKITNTYGVKALAFGNNIYFSAGAYKPYSKKGQELIAHEVAHVVQQRENQTENKSFEQLEGEAETESKKAVESENIETKHYSTHKSVKKPFVQFFEAPKHESIERLALSVDSKKSNGFSQDEISMVYYGNWMRDMNQAFAPILVDSLGADMLYASLGILSFKKFGKIPTREQLGYYIPSEHLDSPAGAVPNSEYPATSPNLIVPENDPLQLQKQVNPEGANPIDDRLRTHQESTDPIKHEKPDKLGLFDYDSSGVMGFMRRSNRHLEKRLVAAADAGRNEDGMLHLGAALHVVEDLFAHSNFVEIAVDKILQEKNYLPDLPKEHRTVQTFSPRKMINGKSRPLLTTGSFTSNDTSQSIGHEAVNFLGEKPTIPTDEEIELKMNFLKVMAGYIDSNKKLSAKIVEEIKNAKYEKTSTFIGWLSGVTTFTGIVSVLNAISRSINYITPNALKNVLHQIDLIIYNNVNIPIVKAVEADLLEKEVRNTSLLKVYETDQINSNTHAEPNQMMKSLFGEEKAKASAELGKKTASKRVEYLEKTPEEVIAGPTHSQIAKDHSGSVFFGLAFKLAVLADIMIKDELVNYWGNNEYKIPDRDYIEDKDTVAKAMQNNNNKRLNFATNTYSLGYDRHQKPDLEKEENNMKLTLLNLAYLFDKTTLFPDQTEKAAEYLNKTLDLKIDATLIQNNKSYFDFSKTAQQLKELANVISNPNNRTVASREKLYNELQKLEEELLKEIQSTPINYWNGNAKTPFPNSDEITIRYIQILMRRVKAFIAPSYYKKQDDILKGKHHLKTKNGNDWGTVNYKNVKYNHTDYNKLNGKDYTKLINVSREIMNHPYETSWWKNTVENYFKKHPKIMRDYIIARNMGIANFRHEHKH